MTWLSETFITWSVTLEFRQVINQETVCRKRLNRLIQTQSRTKWFSYRVEVQKSQVDNTSFCFIVQSQRWGLQERWETVWLYWEHIERPLGKVNLLASKYKQAQSNYSRIVSILARSVSMSVNWAAWGLLPGVLNPLPNLNENFYLWSHPLTKSVLKWSAPLADCWLVVVA
jgi:hypothetical protein